MKKHINLFAKEGAKFHSKFIQLQTHFHLMKKGKVRQNNTSTNGLMVIALLSDYVRLYSLLGF